MGCQRKKNRFFFSFWPFLRRCVGGFLRRCPQNDQKKILNKISPRPRKFAPAIKSFFLTNFFQKKKFFSKIGIEQNEPHHDNQRQKVNRIKISFLDFSRPLMVQNQKLKYHWNLHQKIRLKKLLKKKIYITPTQKFDVKGRKTWSQKGHFSE